MIITKKHELTQACAKRKDQAATIHPFSINSRIYSTDGRIMAVWTPKTTLEDGWIPTEAFIEARKTGQPMAVNGQSVSVGATTYGKDLCDVPGEPPQVHKILQRAKNHAKDNPTIKLALDAELLLKLAKAIGAEPGPVRKGRLIILTIAPEADSSVTRPIHVRSYRDDTEGVIMPCSIKGFDD